MACLAELIQSHKDTYITVGATQKEQAEQSEQEKAKRKEDYNASRTARPRRDGMCCRPACTEPIWHGNNGEISAFCGKAHANSHSLGFKPTVDTHPQSETDPIRAPSLMFDEYYAAMNTAQSSKVLTELQLELATSMAHLTFSVSQADELREVYKSRLNELKDPALRAPCAYSEMPLLCRTPSL